MPERGRRGKRDDAPLVREMDARHVARAMGHLTLVRHGQASALTGDYDRLSERGHAQAKLLGAYWAARGTTFDHVFVGPRRRHRETYENVRDALAAAGTPLPAPVPLEELDEHHGIVVFLAAMPKLMATHPEIAELAANVETAGGRLRLFRRVMRLWAEDRIAELHPEDAERFDAFVARVRRGLSLMTYGAEHGARIAAFTSAGATAAAACLALGIDDARAMDLSFEIVNGSLTRLRFSKDRLTLSSMNETPHLPDDMLTNV